jgi:hypothetical protein
MECTGMLWKKKPLKTDDRPSDEGFFAQRISKADAERDKRAELVHRLMLVSMEAETFAWLWKASSITTAMARAI